jgi:hypothetical protein
MAMNSDPRSSNDGQQPGLAAFEAAYQAATECANRADALVIMLTNPAPSLLKKNKRVDAKKQRIIDESNACLLHVKELEKGSALEHLRVLLQNKHRHESAISAVGPELLDTRSEKGPVKFRTFTWDTAHGAALEFRDQVFVEIQMALARDSVKNCRTPQDLTAPPEVDKLAENYEAVCQHFHKLEPGTWPDHGDLLAEIRWEARKAAPRGRSPLPGATRRLEIDLESNTITLDGKQLGGGPIDPAGVRLVGRLRKHIGTYVSSTVISEMVPGCSGGRGPSGG